MSVKPYDENTALLNNGFHRPHLQSDTSSLVTLTRERKISDSRRTFCLMVLFDLLLTTVLWLFECGTQSNESRPFLRILHNQVTQYSMYSSMFDVLVLSAVRFFFLQLTYAILRIEHWWPVATSTTISNMLTFGKIFVIFNRTYLNIPMTVVCLVFAFCITWVEVWFLDSKVLPEEQAEAERLLHQQTRDHVTPAYVNEYQRAGFHPQFQPFPPAASSRYFSPAASIEPSESGSQEGFELTRDEEELVSQGKYAFERILMLYNDPTLWSLEQKKGDDEVYSYEDPEYGKTFKLRSLVEGFEPAYIFENVLMKGEEFPVWNKTILSVKKLKTIGRNSSVTSEISAPAAMGMIASRQFVTIRSFRRPTDGGPLDMYVSAGMSTHKIDDEIEQSSYVRGFNGPTGFILSSSRDVPLSCNFVWILNTDLKGNLSRGLVNRNLVSTMFSFVSSMRKHLAQLEL